MTEELLKEKITQAILETLVINNKQSLPRAVDKIITIISKINNND